MFVIDHQSLNMTLWQVPNGDSEQAAAAFFPKGRRRILLMGLYHSCTNAVAKELESSQSCGGCFFSVAVFKHWKLKHMGEKSWKIQFVSWSLGKNPGKKKNKGFWKWTQMGGKRKEYLSYVKNLHVMIIARSASIWKRCASCLCHTCQASQIPTWRFMT